MLATQVNYWNLQETKLHNRNTEEQARRDLAEIYRHNLAVEKQQGKQAQASLKQAKASWLNAQTNLARATWEKDLGYKNAAANLMQAQAAAKQASAALQNAATNARNAATNARLADLDALLRPLQAKAAVVQAEARKSQAETARSRATWQNLLDMAKIGGQDYTNLLNQAKAETERYTQSQKTADTANIWTDLGTTVISNLTKLLPLLIKFVG